MGNHSFCLDRGGHVVHPGLDNCDLPIKFSSKGSDLINRACWMRLFADVGQMSLYLGELQTKRRQKRNTRQSKFV